jgi:transposase
MARRGSGIREISRDLGISRNTVRRYLREPDVVSSSCRARRAHKLDAFESFLRERVASASPEWIPATDLLEEIRALGYTGGISRLRWWLSALKPRRDPTPVVRFETDPGEQMQADFVCVRRGSNPLQAFVATMGYSRASFVRFSARQDEAALLAGLREAFDFLGGVPRHVLFDNAKTVVVARDAYGENGHRWNPALLDFANECGFSLRVCRPYRAQTKGKVERFNRYLRQSFLVPLKARLKSDGLELDECVANHAVRLWLHEVANERIHATTREVPNQRLLEERSVLLPAPEPAGPARIPRTAPFPVESLQHPLSRYDEFLGPALREAMEAGR